MRACTVRSEDVVGLNLQVLVGGQYGLQVPPSRTVCLTIFVHFNMQYPSSRPYKSHVLQVRTVRAANTVGLSQQLTSGGQYGLQVPPSRTVCLTIFIHFNMQYPSSRQYKSHILQVRTVRTANTVGLRLSPCHFRPFLHTVAIKRTVLLYEHGVSE